MKILMVCLGNICRSPLAEGILRHKIAERNLNWKVDSAGTNGYHIGQPPHRFSQKVAMLNGIDISSQRARMFTANDFEQYNLIIAMAVDVIEEMKRIAGKKFEAEKTMLLLDVLFPGKNIDVPDPWFGEEDGYFEVYDMIEKACETFINQSIKNSV